MATWMQPVNFSSGTITVPIPAGEIWLLNSLSGMGNSTTTRMAFGTANVPLVIQTGSATSTTQQSMDSFGSAATLRPAFSNAFPLVLTVAAGAGIQVGMITGHKYLTADAPYVPVVVGATAMAVGARLSLQPPAGKVWRLLAIGTTSVASHFIDIATDSTPTWLSTLNGTNVLLGGRADLWSWRSNPLSIRCNVASANIYAYLLEVNEADFLPYRVGSVSVSLAAGATADIQPALGEDWVVDVYMNQAYSITPMSSGTPGTALTWSSARNYSPGPFRIDNASYIRVTNTSANPATLMYMGIKAS
jgi:hypothetical protein